MTPFGGQLGVVEYRRKAVFFAILSSLPYGCEFISKKDQMILTTLKGVRDGNATLTQRPSEPGTKSEVST